MADLDYDEYTSEHDFAYDAQSRLADRARRWVNIGGAVCSVTLVLGLALWGYKLAVRDVTGIPVMRAVAGAMRIAPSDPGGEQALNQGLTVNAIAATGTSAAPSDQITLAPQAVTLRPSDIPQAAEAPQAPAPMVTGEAMVIEASAPASAPATTLASTAAVDAAVAQAVLESDPNAIRESLRPQPRPAGAGRSSLPIKVQTVSSQSAAKEIDPANVAVGTRLAQLGAFETTDLARAKFTELQGDFGDLMKGKSMLIQSAQSGGRTFYRLRAVGFDTDDDTRRFCSAFRAENADCIPVAQR
ncbi:MAG: SPOR domain-containing protein [Cypionkella sp.]